jgi:hypothetical protein
LELSINVVIGFYFREQWITLNRLNLLMIVLENVKILMDVNGFHTLMILETAFFSRIAQCWMKPLKGPQLAK